VTAIKPPGSPGGIQAPTTPESTKGPSGTTGPSFQDRVAEQQGATPAASVSTPQGVIAELRAGRLSPNEALSRLTDLAIQRSGAPASMRPQIEVRMRELLSNDPVVKDLVRRMGASVSSEE
jgi:hypothetical protein